MSVRYVAIEIWERSQNKTDRSTVAEKKTKGRCRNELLTDIYQNHPCEPVSPTPATHLKGCILTNGSLA